LCVKILKTKVSNAIDCYVNATNTGVLLHLENQTLLNCNCTFSHFTQTTRNRIHQICLADVQEAVLLTTCLTLWICTGQTFYAHMCFWQPGNASVGRWAHKIWL